MRPVILSLVLLVPVLSLADPTPAPAPATPAAAPAVVAPAPKPASSLDTNKDGKVDSTELANATNADATVTDVIKDGTAVVDAAKGLKDPSMPKGVAIAVLLGTLFKLLLSLLKVVAKNVAWFKSQDGKRVLKYSTLGLGALAALMANWAFGMSWMDSLVILLSGPIAVAIHEYTSDSKPVPEPPKT